MSAQFGPSPKFREYFLWAEQQGGCTVNYGTFMRKALVKVIGSSGKYVLQVGIPDSEPMRHELVAHFDRVLGIESPFPKTPEPYD